jgi:hypothetical protein
MLASHDLNTATKTFADTRAKPGHDERKNRHRRAYSLRLLSFTASAAST